MATLTGAIRPETQFPDNLLSPLSDAARRERTVVLALLIYVVLWTAYGVIAKGSQDVHIDMSEQFMLARELALGYSKHPPLTMLIVRLWFGVFPTTDWAGYKCRACAVDRVAALRAVSRRREAGSRAGAADARAVLQLPCSQVQSEYGVDAFVGRNHPVLSALV